VLGSHRAAAIGALAYVGAPNYLFFSAQFAYESLALPLALLVLVTAARAAGAQDSRAVRNWTALGISVVPAIAMTHHLTSYALAGALAMVCVSAWAINLAASRRSSDARAMPWRPERGPVAHAAAAAIAVAVWLVFAGRQTSGYLSPVLTRAISQTWGVLSREAPPRSLFEPARTASDNAVGTAPAWERALALGSVAVVAVAIPAGILAVWRARRLSAVMVLLIVASVAYLGTFPLRFVPAAWETAARASEFLFIGVCAVVAASLVDRPRVLNRRQRGAAVVTVAVLVVGGIVAGWPSARRLAAPYRVDAAGAVVESEQISFGKWAAERIGRGQRIASEESAARVLQLYGGQFAIAGRNPDVEDILHLPTLDPWMLELLSEHRIGYVAVDRRRVSADNMIGYFFSADGGSSSARWPEAVYGKLDRIGAPRVFDSGDIVLYDVRPILLDGPSGAS
jgi:hypothetical protein